MRFILTEVRYVDLKPQKVFGNWVFALAYNLFEKHMQYHYKPKMPQVASQYLASFLLL